jgi:hypothetical protein
MTFIVARYGPESGRESLAARQHEGDMAKRHQWHSARDGERVHHDHEDCQDGQQIDYYWLRHNAGGRPLCDTCARLNAADAEDARRLMWIDAPPTTHTTAS